MSAAALVRKRYADELRQEVDGRLDELRKELASISHQRPPASGPGMEGSAWSEYQHAYDLLASRPPNETATLTQATLEASITNKEERFAAAIELSAEFEQEIRSLREGVSRLNASPQDHIAPDGNSNLPKLNATRLITSVLALQGIAAIETGNSRGGANMILDAIQFAQDLTRSQYLLTQLVGSSALIPYSLKIYLEQHPLENFDPLALEKLDEGVLSLIQASPAWPEQRGELGLLQTNLERVGLTMNASVARETLSMLDWAEQLPHEHALASIRELQRLSNQPNLGALQAQYFRSFLSSAIQVRHCVVQLHMLHAAIREARGLDPEPFQEPFKMPLEVEEDSNPRVMIVLAPSDISAGPVRLRLARPQ